MVARRIKFSLRGLFIFIACLCGIAAICHYVMKVDSLCVIVPILCAACVLPHLVRITKESADLFHRVVGVIACILAVMIGLLPLALVLCVR